MKIKAQIAIEFVLLVSVVIGITTILIATANFNIALARQKNEQEILEDFANFLQQELIIASKMHPFYAREFILPERIAGKIYTVVVEDYYLVVGTPRFNVTKGIPLVERDCRNFKTGKNNITKTKDGLRINC
ncbi:MAG: hypothetical protein NZ889_02145 [Candidatus Pacearchaeota archaeon]|nr:hypothetical protein [Candidatus Pacearchaeota archaeon]